MLLLTLTYKTVVFNLSCTATHYSNSLQPNDPS